MPRHTTNRDADHCPGCTSTGSAHKPCPAGCEARGNCNAEEGRCECPFGWTGPACEVAKFPACKISNKSDEVGAEGNGSSGIGAGSRSGSS